MSTDGRSSAGCKRGRITGLAIIATVALSLASVASASAAGPTATLAPIGTGSYLLTVTTGSEKLEHGLFLVGQNLTNFAVAKGTCSPAAEGAFCEFLLPPVTSEQICYSGGPVTEVKFNLTEDATPSSAPAVGSCPVPGFTPASSGGGGGTGGSGGSGSGAPGGSGSAPAQTAKCVVPALKGKTLAKAKKKLTAADCTLGKVKGKKGKSAKVTKQSPAAGKTLAPGAKVGVTVK
jgi:PASTA domain-containing protein